MITKIELEKQRGIFHEHWGTEAPIPVFFMLALGYIAGFLAHDIAILLDPADIVENIHDAYDHPRFRDKAYSFLMSGPSGSADIGGIMVHPAQGVMTLTLIFWPRGKNGIEETART